jgi:hypothetical protein
VHYWYFVTAVDENGLESSKFLSRTDPAIANPIRGSAIPVRDASIALDSVYVVPNPFHIKSQRLYNLSPGIIQFVGLPAQCRIRIYTQNGDRVSTIYHKLEDPPRDIEDWNLLSDSDQFLASGLYIFVIDQAKDGQGNALNTTKVDKFVIIR